MKMIAIAVMVVGALVVCCCLLCMCLCLGAVSRCCPGRLFKGKCNHWYHGLFEEGTEGDIDRAAREMCRFDEDAVGDVEEDAVEYDIE